MGYVVPVKERVLFVRKDKCSTTRLERRFAGILGRPQQAIYVSMQM